MDIVGEFIATLKTKLSEISGIPVSEIKHSAMVEDSIPPGGEVLITIAGISVPFSITDYVCYKDRRLTVLNNYHTLEPSSDGRYYAIDHTTLESIALACKKIRKAKEKIRRLKAEIEELRYRPGGPGYDDAKLHYESIQKQ